MLWEGAWSREPQLSTWEVGWGQSGDRASGVPGTAEIGKGWAFQVERTGAWMCLEQTEGCQ